MMSNPQEISILSKWLEERLKEYFVKENRRNSTEFLNTGTDFRFSNQNNGIPIETAFFDFRVLDLQLEAEHQDENGGGEGRRRNGGGRRAAGKKGANNHFNLFDVQNGMPKLPSSKTPSDYEAYKQGNSHVYLVYQKGSQSVGKELLLNLYAAQISDMPLVENIPKYILSLDEHQIDVYTKVFPTLKSWIVSQNVCATLPVPECFYGCYQNEEHNLVLKTEDLADDIFRDDIMSKVAVGMEYCEKLTRNEYTVKKSSYRLLILEDIGQHGFHTRNVDGTTFLSLLNVEEALRKLAEIHSTSWAFAQITGKSFSKTWPFLIHPMYLPYIRKKVIPGYVTMLGTVHDHLVKNGTEEKDEVKRIMKHLIILRLRLDEVLAASQHPRTVKCLIHQDTSFSSFLFRYTLLSPQDILLRKKLDTRNGTMDDEKEQRLCQNVKENEGERKEKENSDGERQNETAHREKLVKGLRRDALIINWRTASYGSPMIDVAFLLLTALPPKTRQVETVSLLKIYWNAFRMQARKFGLNLRWSEKELYEDYLESLLYACVLTTGNLSCGSELDPAGIDVFVQAMKDLIAAEVI